MKIIAVVLLLLNLAYVGWIQFGIHAPLRAGGAAEPLPAPASEPRFEQAKTELMLTKERSAVPAAAPSVEAVAVVPDVPVSQPLPWCAMATGFQDAASAEGFAAAVSDVGGEAEVISEEVAVSSSWWVHLPAFPTEAAAAEVLAELQNKQIDSFYITSGELAGAISLGVFSRSERALIAQQELSAKGYPASVREIFRYATQSSVSVTLENAQLSQEPAWLGLQAGFPAAELHEIACK